VSATVEWTGLAELKEELRSLPGDASVEASHLIEGIANGAATDIKAVYGAHRVTGHLQESVVIERQSAGAFGTAIVVKSTDPMAWLFDNGSQARHWASGKSTGQMWGKTPPTHAFVQIMIRARRQMYEQLTALLVRKGLVVSGDA
jgi:hypothetical protein